MSIGTITAGTIVYINQIDKIYHKAISNLFFDWEYWDLPVRRTSIMDWYE